MDGDITDASSSSKTVAAVAMTGHDVDRGSQSQQDLPPIQTKTEKYCQSFSKLPKGDDQAGAMVMASASDFKRGILNPIFIPSIIYHIGSFLSCADLKRCRRLNKQWNEECSKLLRTKGLVKLTTKVKIHNFISQFKNKSNFCYNFYFEWVNLSDSDVQGFFAKFGPVIKYFKLDFSAEENHLSDREFYELIFIKLPNLEELSLVGCISEDEHFLPEGKRCSTPLSNKLSVLFSSSSSPSTVDEVQMGVQVGPILTQLKKLEVFLCNASGENVRKSSSFLIELLNCTPNLEVLSVPKVPRMLSFGMPLLHTLITTEQLNFEKLQHLDMDIALYNGSIDILKSKGYPLKYLNAEVTSAVSEDSLHSFLETYKKTLIALQLKFPHSPVASSELRLSKSFKALRHLTLHGYKGSLKFLEELHLQTFGLIDNAFTIALRRPNFAHALEAQFAYKMVWTDWTDESYSFDCLDSSDSQLLRMFYVNFPNLTSLNLPHLNDFDLRIIYKNFSHSLQELTMDNPLCSDVGITGISIVTLPYVGGIEGGKLKEEEYRTLPFIGNLKRLKKLEIFTASVNMTDASISFGIVHCENLNTLILRSAPITDVGLRRLVDSMHLEYLETTMCANIRASGVKYALEKMTKREMTFIWNTNQSRMTSCCLNRFLNGNEPVTCIVP